MRHRIRWFPLTLVALAGLALSRCGSSAYPTGPGGGPTPTPAQSANQVAINGMSFTALTVPAGTLVTWRNNDSTAHTATSDPASAFQFDTGTLAPGETSRSILFESAGSFPYHCTLHPTMRATIVVQ